MESAGPDPPGPITTNKFLAAQGQNRDPETQLFGLPEALLRMRNRPHRARQADFAEIDEIGRKGKTKEISDKPMKGGPGSDPKLSALVGGVSNRKSATSRK